MGYSLVHTSMDQNRPATPFFLYLFTSVLYSNHFRWEGALLQSNPLGFPPSTLFLTGLSHRPSRMHLGRLAGKALMVRCQSSAAFRALDLELTKCELELSPFPLVQSAKN